MVTPLETIEYWYVGTHDRGERVRFHKRVHFFLIEYRRGDVGDHDDEVSEARWVPLGEAEQMLAFVSEQKLIARARALLQP